MLLVCRRTSPTKRVDGCRGGNRYWVGGRYDLDLMRFNQGPISYVILAKCCFSDALGDAEGIIREPERHGGYAKQDK